MTRGLVSLVTGCLLALTALVPAFAEEGGSGKSADSGSKSDAKSGGGGANLPTRLASFTVGFIGGVPVALVKKSGEAIMDGAKDLCGANTSPFVMVPAAIFSTPWGALSGALQAPLVSAITAWKASEDEPFSKATFGLSDGD